VCDYTSGGTYRLTPTVMRILIPAFLSMLTACGSITTQKFDDPITDIAYHNLTQKTCALFVSIHSGALGPVPFGRDIDDAMVRWNMCPGGTMVACVKTPTASGDSMITGIPWPH